MESEIVNEVAKNLPVKEVYNDLAHPTLSTIGKTLQGVARVALAPVSALVWGYDKIASYLDVAIPEYFAKRKIKKENIKSPDPSIAVPIIEALRYTSHKQELREMFTNLLGSSMNSEKYDEHPAFVEIIKQLCTDECKMIKYLHLNPKLPIIKIRLKHEGGGESDFIPYFSNICFNISCEMPFKFPEYLYNLQRLGIISICEDRYLVDDTKYKDLRTSPHFPKFVFVDDQQTVEKKGFFELTEFGKRFCSACVC